MNRIQLVLHSVLEQRISRSTRLLETRQTEIVAPAFEQSEAHLLVGEGPAEKWEIFADELLLEVDRVRRHDRALAVRGRPSERGNEVAKRFADTGARLEQSDTAVVVQPCD